MSLHFGIFFPIFPHPLTYHPSIYTTHYFLIALPFPIALYPSLSVGLSLPSPVPCFKDTGLLKWKAGLSLDIMAHSRVAQGVLQSQKTSNQNRSNNCIGSPYLSLFFFFFFLPLLPSLPRSCRPRKTQKHLEQKGERGSVEEGLRRKEK